MITNFRMELFEALIAMLLAQVYSCSGAGDGLLPPARHRDRDHLQHRHQPLHPDQRGPAGGHEGRGSRHHHRHEDQHPLPVAAQRGPGPPTPLPRDPQQPHHAHTRTSR